jgi:3-methyladenine DNA glycosylase AlkD
MSSVYLIIAWLAHEKEFFIQKAIGWALRDYARHAPDAVRLFTRKKKSGSRRSLSVRRINTSND